ncbi:MAG: DUF3047 domain-containing protein [Desulfuromonadaceae bacterium]|nr:DUF3047 domain-containing protein [Desulfuromonadaceae bacterium]
MLIRLVLFIMLISFSVVPVLGAGSIVVDDFEHGLNPAWEETRFKGETIYTVVAEGGGKVLRAVSNGTASGLALKKTYRLQDYPLLTWRWKVDNIIRSGDATRQSGDDYAARIYVVFPHWFFPRTRTINYIWANKLPQGETLPNSFTRNAMMIAVESGAARVGEWITERVDVYADYRRIFGEEPPAVGAIALMTDTDNTGERAVACYDDIRIEQR